MNEFISLAVEGIQAAIKYAPGIITDIKDILSKPDPTEADWQALKDKINNKSYGDYVPASALPK